MPTVTSRTAKERDAALFIFSSHGVAQWGEESLFLFSVYLLPWVFSGMERGGPPSPGNFTASALSPSLSACPMYYPSGKERW